jgi:hypothetical protein
MKATCRSERRPGEGHRDDDEKDKEALRHDGGGLQQ